MAFKVTKTDTRMVTTVTVEESGGSESPATRTYALAYEPSSDGVRVGKTADGYTVLAYLVQDYDAVNPLENCDCMGEIIRNDPPLEKFNAAKQNPYGVPLDAYEHGGICYSVHGSGMRCQWDTSANCAVWVPDKCLIEQIDEEVKATVEQTEDRDRDRARARTLLRELCVKYAREALNEYNAWLAGDCWGIVLDYFDGDSTCVSYSDVCWGCIGEKNAQEELTSQFEGALRPKPVTIAGVSFLAE